MPFWQFFVFSWFSQCCHKTCHWDLCIFSLDWKEGSVNFFSLFGCMMSKMLLCNSTAIGWCKVDCRHTSQHTHCSMFSPCNDLISSTSCSVNFSSPIHRCHVHKVWWAASGFCDNPSHCELGKCFLKKCLMRWIYIKSTELIIQKSGINRTVTVEWSSKEVAIKTDMWTRHVMMRMTFIDLDFPVYQCCR